MNIIQILTLVPGIYFLAYSIYWLVLVISGRRKNRSYPGYINEESPEILILLPAYSPGPVFKKVLDAVQYLGQGRRVSVYVLLQNAEVEYAPYAAAKGFFVEEKRFDFMGGNSYQYALKHMTNVIQREQRAGRWNPEFVMLVDKDNVLSPDFLNNIPDAVYDRFDIIQGRRGCFSTSNAISFFDHTSEMLNDTMFRAGKQFIGSAIEISGSGALIETDLFLESIQTLDASAPGFDKNFMVNLLTGAREIRTAFWPASELKEEKTSQADVHQLQRVRWFGEQYYNAVRHSKDLWKAFVKYRRFAALDYLITLWRPPRSIQFLLVPMLALSEWILFLVNGNWITFFPIFTVAAVFMFIAVASFLVTNGIFLTSLRYSLQLPALVFRNLVSVIRSFQKKNRGTFIHTAHRL